MPKCLLCKKELEVNECGPSDGGCAIISFGYGSRHDQIGYSNPPEGALDKMLSCDEIRCVICDDCFEKNLDLFEGYRIKTHTKKTRVI
jgi:hypothetical protein